MIDPIRGIYNQIEQDVDQASEVFKESPVSFLIGVPVGLFCLVNVFYYSSWLFEM